MSRMPVKHEDACVVAIDGPSASGKSTLAKGLAAHLGFLHVDSGAFYRAVTWRALQENVDVHDEASLTELADGIEIEPSIRGGQVMPCVDGREPGEAVRSASVNRNVSPVAACPAVRRRVTACLRSLRQLGPLVMEGRDIGTAVFPDADCKFYLQSDPRERARRRHRQFPQGNEGGSVEEVAQSLGTRDRIDSGRTAAPLRCAEDACRVDNTNLDVGETLAFVLERLPDRVHAAAHASGVHASKGER